MFNLIGKAYAVSGSNLHFNFDLYNGDIYNFVAMIINALLLLLGVIAVIFFIYGGAIYLTAGGDAEKAGKGRVVITNAIIGIVIILVALAITRFISQNING